MKYISIIVLLAGSQIIFCQAFEWNSGFHGFFDNREYFNKYTTPQTIFGSRIYFELGFSIKENHHFKGGFNYMHEFGSKEKWIDPDAILYYNFSNEKTKFFFGSFPRKGLIKQPSILLSDTLDYYRTNVEGIFAELKKNWGYQNIWLDWTSRQTITNNEAFLLGGSGMLQKNKFILQEHFQMYHHAGTAVDTAFHIRDNAGAVIQAGFDFSSSTIFDSLVILTGYTYSYDRLRHTYDFKHYHGSLTEVLIQYKFFGIKETFYTGDGQVQLYGDGFYKSYVYNRLDLFVYPFYKDNVDVKIQYSIHDVPSKIDFSGYIHVYVNFGGRIKVKENYLN